ncbi:hypothetical protein [Haladaptatus sp. CMSO5]|uniref:hypothetical protein n=1 Tax=Haladaptatus sp. CMSO5 TaxID=3120514 RepID=UPI002FCE16E3
MSIVVGAFVLLIIVSFTVGLSGFGGPDTSDQDLVFDDVVTHDPVTPDPTTSAPTTTPPVTTTTVTTTEHTASPDPTTTTEEPVTTTERKRSRHSSSDSDDSTTTTATPVTTTETPVTTTQTPTTTAEPTPTPTPTPVEPTYSPDTKTGHYHVYLATGRPYQSFNDTRNWSYIDNDQLVYMLYGNTVTGGTEGVQNTGWQDEYIQECVDFTSVEVNDTAVRMNFYVHEDCGPLFEGEPDSHSWFTLAVYQMPNGEYTAPENPEMELVHAKARYFSSGHHYIIVDLPEN